MLFMCSSLILQQCPTCVVRLVRWGFGGCTSTALWNLRVYVVHPYISMDTAITWKKPYHKIVGFIPHHHQRSRSYWLRICTRVILVSISSCVCSSCTRVYVYGYNCLLSFVMTFPWRKRLFLSTSSLNNKLRLLMTVLKRIVECFLPCFFTFFFNLELSIKNSFAPRLEISIYPTILSIEPEKMDLYFSQGYLCEFNIGSPI